MSAYIVRSGETLRSPSAAWVSDHEAPEDALAMARQMQLLFGFCFWVERDDGCILGGTYPWLANGSHAAVAERLNVERGFLATEPMKRPPFVCARCGANDVRLVEGAPRCGCGALLYSQRSGPRQHFKQRLCASCGGPAMRMAPTRRAFARRALCDGCE